jgi:hypothetical protein
MNSVSTYVFPEFCQPTSHQHSLQKAWTNLPLPGQQLYSPVLEKGWTPWIIKTPRSNYLRKNVLGVQQSKRMFGLPYGKWTPTYKLKNTCVVWSDKVAFSWFALDSVLINEGFSRILLLYSWTLRKLGCETEVMRPLAFCVVRQWDFFSMYCTRGWVTLDPVV